MLGHSGGVTSTEQSPLLAGPALPDVDPSETTTLPLRGQDATRVGRASI